MNEIEKKLQENKQLNKFMLDKVFENPQKYPALQGAMKEYIKPILYSLNELYGKVITFECFKRILNTKISFKSLTVPDVVGGVPSALLLAKNNKFYRPTIQHLKLKPIDLSPQTDLNEAMKYFANEKNLEKSLNAKGNSIESVIAHTTMVATLIHELMHIASQSEFGFQKSDGKIAKLLNDDYVDENMNLVSFHGGFVVEVLKVDKNGKMNFNEAQLVSSYFVHEGMTESIACDIANSSSFENQLKKHNLPTMGQVLVSYPLYVPMVKLCDLITDQYVSVSYFNGLDYSHLFPSKMLAVNTMTGDCIAQILNLQKQVDDLRTSKEVRQFDKNLGGLQSGVDEVMREIKQLCSDLVSERNRKIKQKEWTKLHDKLFLEGMKNLLDYEKSWLHAFPNARVLEFTTLKSDLKTLHNVIFAGGNHTQKQKQNEGELTK